MADGMILLWIIVGGSITPILQRRLGPRLAAIPIGWRLRFVVLSTVMALIEVITTSMTNLAPVFGSTPEEAHITASTNDFTVVCFHSVVVIAPMFVAWAWMLSCWNFSPLKVLLLFGLTGSLAEGSLNWTSLLGGFWVFVYGLMECLPNGSCGTRCKAVAMVALSDGRLFAVSSQRSPLLRWSSCSGSGLACSFCQV